MALPADLSPAGSIPRGDAERKAQHPRAAAARKLTQVKDRDRGVTIA